MSEGARGVRILVVAAGHVFLIAYLIFGVGGRVGDVAIGYALGALWMMLTAVVSMPKGKS